MRSEEIYKKLFPIRHLEMLKLISATNSNDLIIRTTSSKNSYLAFNNCKLNGDERFWFWILTSKRAAQIYHKMKLEPLLINDAITYYDSHGVDQITLCGNLLISKPEFIDRIEFDFNHNPYKFENCLFSRAKILESDV